MTQPPEPWEKWQEWLQVIQVEIYDLHHHRQIWRGLVDRIEALDLADSEYFLDAFTRMYVAGQAMGVRRQADRDKGSISLARLLTGLINQSRVVTRDRFLAQWELDEIDISDERGRLHHRFHAERANDRWATFAGAPSGRYLEPAVPRADLARLDATAADVSTFATSTIAHTDAKRFQVVPTFSNLDDAVRVVGEIYCRCSLLLTGSAPSPGALAPTIQGDWLAPFRRPLA